MTPGATSSPLNQTMRLVSIAAIVVFCSAVTFGQTEGVSQNSCSFPLTTEDLYLTGTTDAVLKTQRLAECTDEESLRRLAQIASGKYWFALPEVRITAIDALVQRRRGEAAPILARLITPHEPFSVRQHAARAIRDLGCEFDCMYPVLHYLERIQNGELNVEEVVLAETIEKLGGIARKLDIEDTIFRSSDVNRLKSLYDELYLVVHENPQPAVLILSETYGLSTTTPALFGFQVLQKTRLEGSCAPLAAFSSEQPQWDAQRRDGFYAAWVKQRCDRLGEPERPQADQP